MVARRQKKCILAGVKYYRPYNSKLELLRAQLLSNDFHVFHGLFNALNFTVFKNIRPVTLPVVIFSPHSILRRWNDVVPEKLFFFYTNNHVDKTGLWFKKKPYRKSWVLFHWLNMQVSLNNPHIQNSRKSHKLVSHNKHHKSHCFALCWV